MDALVRELERQAREESQRILAEARAEAGRIQREARLEARRQRRRRVERLEEELRTKASQQVASVRRECREEVLRARDEHLDRVFRHAATLLPDAARSPRYLESLDVRVREAVSYLADREWRLRCSPEHLEKIRGALAATEHEGEISADPELETGFLVEAHDGSVTVDATLSTRLRRRRPWLAVEVLRDVRGGT